MHVFATGRESNLVKRVLKHSKAGERKRIAARDALSESARQLIRACEMVAEAREVLRHGDFQSFCADLGVAPRDASRMVQVGRHERLTDRSVISKLPFDPKVIFELARLDPRPFDGLLAAGIISPGLNRTQAGRLVRMTDAGIDVARLWKTRHARKG